MSIGAIDNDINPFGIHDVSYGHDVLALRE